MSTDYRDTVFLPRTEFPMKADLPQREPELVDALGADGPVRAAARGSSLGRDEVRPARRPALRQRPHPHGHGAQQDPEGRGQPRPADAGQGRALRARAGTATACRSSGRSSRSTARRARTRTRSRSAEFRARVPRVRRALDRRPAARSSSAWACSATGTHPYTTMDFRAEAGIVRELGKFLLNGALYRGKKSVMWSVVEKTALAEAEVEYHDHTSHHDLGPLPARRSRVAAGRCDGASVVIWTTTPWTIPANRAVAYGADIAYRAGRGRGGRRRAAVRRLGEPLVAGDRAGPSRSPTRPGSPPHRGLAEFDGAELARHGRRHPLRGLATATTSTCRCWPATSSPPSRHRPRPHRARPRRGRLRAGLRATASRCPTRWPRTAPTPRRCPASTGLQVFEGGRAR